MTRPEETATMLAAPVSPLARPSVAGALRTIEGLLMSAGQRTARRNAWTSVLEDRRRAEDRREAEHLMEAVATRTSQAT